MRPTLTFLGLAAVCVICVNAVYPRNPDCGRCYTASESWCTLRSFEHPCHKWWDTPEDHERGEDPHTQGGGDYEVGSRSCEDEHSEACSGGGLMASLDLRDIVDRGDRAVVDKLDRAGVWMEVNRVRSAVQFLSTCSEHQPAQVVAHLPVTPELLDY